MGIQALLVDFNFALAVAMGIATLNAEIGQIPPGQTENVDLTRPFGFHLHGVRYDLTGLQLKRAEDTAHNPNVSPLQAAPQQEAPKV